MIRVTRLNQVQIVVNSDLIEHIEMTPDTVIALTTGQKILVRETADEVIDRVIRFRRALLQGIPICQSVSCSQPSPSASEAATAPERNGQR